MNKIVFHIGHHKTGTSWLQSQYFSNEKYFNLLNNFQSPWDDFLCKEIIHRDVEDFNSNICKSYLKNIIKENKINILTAERLSGHPISAGFDQEKIANKLYLLSPTAKIILTTRNPENFVVSTYKQMIKEGYCGDFNEFVGKNNWKIFKLNSNYFLQQKIYSTYVNLFGVENVLALEFEEFVSDRNLYLKKIEDFLERKELTDYPINNNKKVNPTLSNNRIRALRFTNRMRKTELNQFPVINIGNKFSHKLSFVIAPLFSRKEVVEMEDVRGFLK